MKTAVDWLVDHLYLVIPNEERNFLEGMRKEELEKEKEQIINAYLKGDSNGCGCYDFATPMDADNYYNETYKR